MCFCGYILYMLYVCMMNISPDYSAIIASGYSSVTDAINSFFKNNLKVFGLKKCPYFSGCLVHLSI